MIMISKSHRIPNQVPKIQVSPSSNTFVDDEGHTLFFHGISQVNKQASYNNGLLYYTSTQLQQLKDWGFTAIRLGFLWDAYEVSPNVFNEEYMNGIENITNMYYEYGMMTILDLHQDLWSPLFCGGHGIPEFYSYPNNNTEEYWKYHNRTYPLPHFKPDGYINDTYSNVFGKVNSKTCNLMVSNTTVGWASSYTTYSLSNAAQRLYDNVDGYLDKLASNFWYKVAQRFANNPGILGYELLNEPWVGDVFNYPELYTPKACDVINLRKVYRKLNDIIRSYDNNTIIFYEPCTGGNDLDATPCGFDTGPGGDEYNSKQSLSFHIYCPLIQSDVPINSSLIAACYELNDLQWKWRLDDISRLNTSGFLTEFGAIPYNYLGFELIDYMMDMCDNNLLSWTYWYLTPTGNISNPNKEVKYLARTYGYKIASNNVITNYFNTTDKHFIIQYIMYSDMVERNLTTKIYFSKEFHYPDGIVYKVTPFNDLNETYVNVEVNNESNVIILWPVTNPTNDSVLLTFQMCPSTSECLFT